jgi:DNA mismatch repair protein MutS2
LLVESRPSAAAGRAEAVVPFDLQLEPEERTLLVSGPNTGGKTVLLKAIGLIAALTQAGVIPPVGEAARGCRCSTISLPTSATSSPSRRACPRSPHTCEPARDHGGADDGEALALIDEMGSGTDPAEGGALAHAILRS